MIQTIVRWVRWLLISKEPASYYRVGFDGGLILDTDRLLKTDKMRKQIEAARLMSNRRVGA